MRPRPNMVDSDAFDGAAMNEFRRAQERMAYAEMQSARQEYLRASLEFDKLNDEVASNTHGMPSPDGLQAVRNLGSARANAFERYRRAISSYANLMIEPK